MKKSFALFIAFSIAKGVFAQKDSLWATHPQVELSGFVDVFYSYDFNQPQTNYRQAFFYNHNRHNEVNVNQGYIKLAVIHPKYRANIALHTGTYVNDNYAAEPGVLKNLYEANAGISLNKKNTLWVDVGIGGSHLGFESAVSIDNATLTRSLFAENSPYYLAGIKGSFTPNDHWDLSVSILNGWQRIQRVAGNSMLSYGSHVKYSPNQQISINWNTFIGTDDPDSTRRMRFFNDLYVQSKLGSRMDISGGLDIGWQQQAKNSSDYNVWFTPFVVVRYAWTKQWSTSVRAEYFADEKGVIIPTNTPNGFKTSGFSANLDYSPIPQLAARIEARWLKSEDNIFIKNNIPKSDDFFVTASLALKFAKLFK